ncbi:hypothetical protein KFL_000860330 [Klebsormidium nitens]|uniref:Uncharacterized protein n=1 Tax=Klebsormidium nitens TaxID=105231 RepID=A0A1Y1HXH2_KLENI|nr:hypothetical protein KFL_000860330 [Klebsormidium nitens]|eukprot:GAQ81661.1 hypothetical protein KFL_000860330 [Klebsormidium nitens]
MQEQQCPCQCRVRPPSNSLIQTSSVEQHQSEPSASVQDTSSESSRSSRRQILRNVGAALTALTLSAAAPGVLWAEPNHNVRLADVENTELRQALEAAVAGDFARAEDMFSDILKEVPDSASVWSNRGSVRLSLGKFEAAAADFSRAIELAPTASVPYLNRAIAYEALARYPEAINDCDAAIKNDPREYAAWFNKGNVETRVANYSGALSDYQRAADLAPGIAGYRLRAATVLFQLKRPDEAAQQISSIVRKYPNYAEAHAALAAILWSQGKRARAEGELNAATTQEPRLGTMKFARAALQWPPSLLEAMERLITLQQ